MASGENEGARWYTDESTLLKPQDMLSEPVCTAGET